MGGQVCSGPDTKVDGAGGEAGAVETGAWLGELRVRRAARPT